MAISSVVQTSVVKIIAGEKDCQDDQLAVEEPLEIRLEYGPSGERHIQNVSVTMRTPGNDAVLAMGFLFTEGIIFNFSDIRTVDENYKTCAEEKDNVVVVRLQDDVVPNLLKADRNFYTTSSCGVCGKASISAIRTVAAHEIKSDFEIQIGASVFHILPALLAQHQHIFSTTGGLHASALFSSEGELLMVYEDVGRHNALDKLIGSALNERQLPLNHHILLLSGRASFELIQKAAMAGIKFVAAVGAPSSLAVQLAKEFGMTLIGFLRESRLNIYCGDNRISLTQSKTLQNTQL